ncbi:uncharacterized protein [Gossypium hirsutum]|uniref:Uncharacterized protein n=1 Tax=Gossypium hirsutum TaxID=3635 RepID=A0ABM3BW82_GOSHI|nr:uncharacterized protein LOC121230480 [Gossypium hirsutum]
MDDLNCSVEQKLKGAEFLRLSRYARERDFAVLVEKARIAEEVKRAEKQNQEKDRNHFRRDSRPLGGANRIIKRVRVEEPVRAVPMNVVRPSICGDCGKVHLGECKKRSGACFRCGSMEHRVRDYPQKADQVQVAEQKIVQPVRGRSQPPRGRGQGRGGNGNDRGRGAPGRGVRNVEARQPSLDYTLRLRKLTLFV